MTDRRYLSTNRLANVVSLRFGLDPNLSVTVPLDDIRRLCGDLEMLICEADNLSGAVKFVGQGPFALPVAQSATANAVGNTVEVSFRVLTDPSQLDVVSIQVIADQATELLALLADAIDKTRAWEKQQLR